MPLLWIDYFRELDTTIGCLYLTLYLLWIDYFRELDTTRYHLHTLTEMLWIDYFRELDTTWVEGRFDIKCCGLITLGN